MTSRLSECIQTAAQNDAASEDELTRPKRHAVNRLRTSILVLNGRGRGVDGVSLMMSTMRHININININISTKPNVTAVSNGMLLYCTI